MQNEGLYATMHIMNVIDDSLTRPFFSIIVTIYNAEKYLPRCIDSILEQSYRDYELILIDDCSKDGSVAICRDYENKDSRVKVVALEQNGGVVNARDVSLKIATGRYMIFVDSDDCYLSDRRLETIHSEIEQNGADIVVTGYQYGVSVEKGKRRLNSLPLGFYPKNEYMKLRERIFAFNDHGTDRWIFPSVWSKAIRKELYDVSVDTVDKRLRMGEDAARTYVALALAESLSVIDDSSYFYFQYPDQMTRGYHKGYFDDSINNYLNIEEVLKKANPEGNYHPAVMENICHVSAYAVLNEGRNPNRNESKEILRRICAHPSVIEANSGYRKSANIFYRHVLSLMEKRAYGRMSVISKLYCMFMQ